MCKPHKWADVIKAWADGKTIQHKHRALAAGLWTTWTALETTPHFSNILYEWRIKPETVKYRRYLSHKHFNPDYGVGVVHYPYKEGNVEKSLGQRFIRWIDTEWQEVEV